MNTNDITTRAMVDAVDSGKKTKNDEKRVLDLYRLSIGTVKNLSQALSMATDEIKRDQSTSDVIAGSELYCDMLPLQLSVGNMWLWREKHSDKYRKMCMGELLKELYLRMQMLYNYGECKGRELPGIAWHMEPTGVFAITLKDCAVNMEHAFQDEPQDRPATLFAVGLNLPLLEIEDPEDKGSALYGEYDEFVTFCCEVRDPATSETENRDIYPTDTYINEQAVRNILGSLDLISERNNEK